MSNCFSKNMRTLNSPEIVATLSPIVARPPAREYTNDSLISLSFPSEALVVVLGFGDGTLVSRLKKRLTVYQPMIVFEPDLESFKGALERKSFKTLFSSMNIRIILGKQKDYSFVQEYASVITNGTTMVISNKEAISGQYSSAHEEFKAAFHEQRMFCDINTSTQVSLGKAFSNSILRNAPLLVRLPGVVSLRNVFYGCPCVLVSAGPSLEKDVDELRKAKGRALIIAVDAALPFLMKNGIHPDIVTGIDPLEDNEALWKLPGAAKIPAIMLAQYTPSVLKRLRHAFVVGMDTNPIYAWLSRCWVSKGCVEIMGGSVSCFAYQIAEYLGCSSVAFVGLDLSFTSKYHVGETSKLLHEHMGLDVPDDTLTGIRIKSRGKWVYTRETLLSFKTAFESRFRTRPYPLPINCTRGGLKIEGTAEMPLKKYLATHGLKTPGGFSEWLTKNVIHGQYDTEKLADEISKLFVIFRGVVKAARRILPLIHEIRALREQNKKEGIHPLVKRIEALRPATIHPALSLIVPYHYQLEIYMKRKEIREMDKIKHKWKRLDQQVDRGLNFYGELIEAVELFNNELRHVLALLKRSDKKKQKEVNREIVGD